ncbi:protein kinase [Massilia sp. YIM B02763]|uniref:serine/threonine-protein kinase n=1 Tax=Massilia sp. YIM B02763 TaxID=3050130 RepID=UPI0025B6B82A|nr:serine/threonine-protein kinase [Massilia sp. YIM B02763]MDN4054875.1 protein kinase [Massilia sp. YIM B02763]
MAVLDDVLPSSSVPSTAFPPAPAHYAFRGRLGEGGHGEVYESWDTKLQRSVAIKRVKHDAVAAGADLMREARMAASLHHPAFVKVHAIEETEDGQFIVMELIPGRTLKRVLAEGKPALADALDWTRQVAEAMQDAHASGLVHGDLKPSNIMLEPSGKVRILDFGLALRHDMLATTTITQSEPQGTIAYMAPERLLGALPDARGDIYSLGVMLYEMVVGKRPFSTLNGLALAAAHIQSSSDSWDYPDSLDTALIALVRGMTARVPEQRIATIGEAGKRILQQYDSSSIDPPRALPSVDSDLKDRRYHLLSPAGFGSVAILLAALAGVAWWQAGPNMKSLQNPLAPYSEAAAMEQALTALKRSDLSGELQDAEKRFNEILVRSPNNAAAVAGISLVYSQRFATDDKDEIWLQKADAGAQLALKLNDQLALSQVAQGAVLDRKGQFAAASEAYERALRLDPNNYFAWRGKVESLRNARRTPQTIAAIDEGIRRFPQEAIFYGELGAFKVTQGDYAAAEQAFRHSIALQPDAVFPYANLNGVLLMQDRSDEALQVLQEGLQIRPSAHLYTNLGNALFVRGDFVGAAKAFENAVSPTRGSPGDYLNWANLADTLLWLPGREQQAKQAYDKARQLLTPKLARAPSDPVLNSRMGLYAVRAGLAVDAAPLVQRALTLAPNDPTVQFRAGMAYELLGKRSLALAAINKAKRLGYPSNFIDAEPDLAALRRDPGYQAE